MTSRTLAVYGGSFDPPHVGHFLVAAFVASLTGVDELLLVPAFEHAFGKRFEAAYEHRVALVRAMARDLPRTRVSTLERDLGGTRYTVDVVRALKTSRPDAALRLVLGADVAAETERWHRWDELQTLAPPLFVRRAGFPAPEASPAIDFPEVSSTEVRRRLQCGVPLEGLVPSSVEQLIRRRNLYGTAS